MSLETPMTLSPNEHKAGIIKMFYATKMQYDHRLSDVVLILLKEIKNNYHCF